MNRILIIAFIFLITCKERPVLDQKCAEFPIPLGAISDYANIYNQAERDTLTKMINDFENSTTNEIAVVTVDSLGGYTDIKIYTDDLSNCWGIGKKEKNNGMVILIAPSLRKMRISTGYGTEKIVTDSIAKIIIDSIFVSNFKNEEFYKGTKEGILAIEKAWE